MLKILGLIVFSILSTTTYANCLDLYTERAESLAKTNDAIECFKQLETTASGNIAKSEALIKITYLHMFKSEFYTEDSGQKMLELKSAMIKSEAAALLFGRLFDIRGYETLGETEKDQVAKALYFYGTAMSRYVEIKGKIEAIKRLSRIKRTMNSVLRIGRDSLEHYGAHRTLAILNAKVPVIAGGDKELARKYFEIVIKNTQTILGASSYPLNNLMFAEFLFENATKAEACAQLEKIAALTTEEVESLNNGYTAETLSDVRKANEKLKSFSCR